MPLLIVRIMNNRCVYVALYVTNLLNRSYKGKLLKIAGKKPSTSIVPYNTEAMFWAQRPLMARGGIADNRGEKQL